VSAGMVDPRLDPMPFPANDVQEAQRRKSKQENKLEFFWRDGERWQCDFTYGRIASLAANLGLPQSASSENQARTQIANALDDLRDRICWLRLHAEKENPVPWARETTEDVAREMMEIFDDLLVALAGAERLYTNGFGDDR
jgi:hypothetical protein